MVQSELFSSDADPSKAHANPESAAAHSSIVPNKKSDRQRIWLLLHESGKKGMTLQQLAWRLARVPSAISGRITELLAEGMIERKAEKGLTESGRSCSIYLAK
jgi:hypothetical protein